MRLLLSWLLPAIPLPHNRRRDVWTRTTKLHTASAVGKRILCCLSTRFQKMLCCFNMGPAAVLVIIVLQSFPSDVGCSEGTDQQNRQPLSEASALTARFPAHNAESLLRVLEEEARQETRLTPEAASLLLADSWSAPGQAKSFSDTYSGKRGSSRALPTQEEAPDSAKLHGKLANALGTAKGAVNKASKQLSTVFGLGGDSTSLLQRWKEGTTAVRGVFGKLFGTSDPENSDKVTQKELENLLAFLVQQQQQQVAPSTAVDSRAEGKQAREHEVVESVFRKGAAGAAASNTSAEAPTGQGGHISREEGSPLLQAVDNDAFAQVQQIVSMLMPGSEGSTLSLLSHIPSVSDLQDHLANVARKVKVGTVGSMGIPGLGTALGLASPLSLGLPATSFGAMSILTQDDTRKNWETLVQAFKQHGKADYTSKEALELMEKLAVVLACAYKTAKTLLGENEANNLIRATIRHNAAFEKQVLSSVKKNLMDGVEPAEEIALAEGASGFGGSLPTEARNLMDVESRLSRELLLKLTHMPPLFYSNVIQKYRETLDQWDVRPNELLSVVKDAVALRFPPSEFQPYPPTVVSKKHSR